MAGSTESISNGQTAQYSPPQTEVFVRRESSKRRHFAIPLAILFMIMCAVFLGFLYYLELRLRSEIVSFNDKINQEFKTFSENFISKIEEYDRHIEALNNEVGDLKFGKKSQLGPGVGEVIKFKAVTIKNMEEFPDVEDVEPKRLVDNPNKKRKNITITTTEEPLGGVNVTRITNKEQIEQFKANMTRLRGQNKTVIESISPDDFKIDEEDSTEGAEEDSDDAAEQFHQHNTPSPPEQNRTITLDEEDNAEGAEEDSDDAAEQFHQHNTSSPPQQNRTKRNAEIVNSGGFNSIESPEVINRNHRSNQTESRKISSSQNQTTAPVNSNERNGTIIEELYATHLQQKSTNRRSSEMKKSSVMRESRSSREFNREIEASEIADIHYTPIAAHFGADSSKYTYAHAYYDGNSFLRHPTGEYEDWRPSSWFNEYNVDNHFTLMNGNIKVHTSGLYFVYAQIYYMDKSEVKGYMIYLNSQVVLQCATSSYAIKNGTHKANTCFTGGVIKCNAGDKIFVRTPAPEKRVMLEPTGSFVGMFKIGEFPSRK